MVVPFDWKIGARDIVKINEGLVSVLSQKLMTAEFRTMGQRKSYTSKAEYFYWWLVNVT